jgi:uncharacterized phage-associated protein
VWHGTPLFPGDLERWDNEPACKELCNIHRGLFPIEGNISPKVLTNKEVSEINVDTIEKIIDDYGMFNSA